MDITYKDKTVIVAPLCWGLGHATRCIPIIEALMQNNNRVILASDGEALVLLRRAFPTLESYAIPAYDITYTYESIFVNMIFQFRKISTTIHKEQKAADEIAKRTKANIIISDNRMGFRSRYVDENIYITHQLNIHTKSRVFSWIANLGHYFFYRKFDLCWVPDYKEKGLAGSLSKNVFSFPVRYIGLLSRLKKNTSNIEKDIDILIVLSGPEPQRTKLEYILSEYFKDDSRKIVLVRGTTAKSNILESNIEYHGLLGVEKLNELIDRSLHIICRSGYSSLMDLVHLGRSATIIPTPGQTEQEYLADNLNGKKGFVAVQQSKLKDTLKI